MATNIVRKMGGMAPKAVLPRKRPSVDLSRSAVEQRKREAAAQANGHDAQHDVANERAGWTVPPAIDEDEWTSAKLAPECIVEDYLFADVACQVAPGTTGKTTASLYEAAHIVLGRTLWGLRVWKPGPVLYVTAEDRREFLVGRLREICVAMGLTPEETAKVRDLVRIDDCTKQPRRLTAVVADVVMSSGFGESIVTACLSSGFAPVLVQFDPLVSFGVGEARVNDAEQGLIEAARVIVGGLNACVRYVHHTGKANAREKSIDQYTGRGGSTLADGARMVAVMQPMDAAEWKRATGFTLDADVLDAERRETAFVIARPKLSYAPPQAHIYVVRRRYSFKRVTPATPIEANEQRRLDANQLLLLIESERRDGRLHTKKTLEDMRPENLTRDRVRAALAFLESGGRVEVKKREGSIARGARDFLSVVASQVANGEAN